MAEYIERKAALDAIDCDITITGRQNAELVAATIGTFADRIKALPAADVVQVVRCKDCNHHSYDEIFSCYWCEHPGMVREVKPDFYCAYGESEE